MILDIRTLLPKPEPLIAVNKGLLRDRIIEALNGTVEWMTLDLLETGSPIHEWRERYFVAVCIDGEDMKFKADSEAELLEKCRNRPRTNYEQRCDMCHEIEEAYTSEREAHAGGDD